VGQVIAGVKEFKSFDAFLCFCILTSCQLDNVDEQAAQIRRELVGRLQAAERLAQVNYNDELELRTTTTN